MNHPLHPQSTALRIGDALNLVVAWVRLSLVQDDAIRVLRNLQRHVVKLSLMKTSKRTYRSPFSF